VPGGKELSRQTFPFTEGDESLRAGQKYFRRFNYDTKTLSTPVTAVKALGAEAVLSPDLGALKPKKE
jgi:hypothetical protein